MLPKFSRMQGQAYKARRDGLSMPMQRGNLPAKTRFALFKGEFSTFFAGHAENLIQSLFHPAFSVL